MDYLFDALCHLNCSLFGIYLVVSGQVKLDGKSFLKAVIFMYTVITAVVILNFIFHTNNFGMCPYGGYSIYMFNLFEDYVPTLIAYYLGVLVVLYIGFEFNYALNKINGLTQIIAAAEGATVSSYVLGMDKAGYDRLDAIAKQVKTDKPLSILYIADSLADFDRGFHRCRS